MLNNESWTYKGVSLEVVNNFNYLGTVFNYTGTFVLNQETLVSSTYFTIAPINIFMSYAHIMAKGWSLHSHDLWRGRGGAMRV